MATPVLNVYTALALTVAMVSQSISLETSANSSSSTEELSAVPPSGASNYTFTTIDMSGIATFASGINDRGEIVGSYLDNPQSSTTHAFVRARRAVATVDIRDSVDQSLIGINDHGQMVGIYRDVNFTPIGFFMDRFRVTTIEVPDAAETAPLGINDQVQIVGAFGPTGGLGPIRGFLKDGDAFTTLEFPGASETRATGINTHGRIVGEYVDANGAILGFAWKEGVFTTIKVPGGKFFSSAKGISDNGYIVGIYGNRSGVHGFLLNGGEFLTIDFPGARDTRPVGVNKRSDIVGEYTDDLGKIHGFVAVKNRT